MQIRIEQADLTSSTGYKRPESVLVVVYTVCGDTLLLQRVWPVFWQSVTGSLEWPDEKPADAARREVYEETGIEAVSGWHDWSISRFFPILPAYQDRFPTGTKYNQEHMFSLELVEACSVKLMSSEHSDSDWCSLKSARNRVWGWTNRIALDQVISRCADMRTVTID